MFTASLLEELKKKFGDLVTGANLEALDPWIEVAPHGLVEVCRYLKSEPGLQYNLLNCITGVDYYQPEGRKPGQAEGDPHLEVVYHLSSTIKKHALVLKVMLPRWKDDVPGQLPELPTVSGVWRTAEWHEREVYDLMGVVFVGHPDLRRILCPEDWVGHPLRKDYKMPRSYHGLRGG